jgi:arylsulfatase A-like enzyme
MRKLSLAIAVLLLQACMISFSQLGAQPQGARGTTRPNILFILADDLGAEASSLYPDLYNSSAPSAVGQVPTPTISALAARGVVFDNVWATPLCSPTRAAILTGLYGHNTSVTTVGNILPGNTTSIFELIRDSAGSPRYNMSVFGKWHLGGAGANGMNHVVNETGVPLYKGLLGSGVTNYYNWTLNTSTVLSAPTTTYTTTALTDFAIDFIRSQNQSTPWFMYLPYNAPHGTAADNGFQVPPANLFNVDVGARPAGTPAIYNGAIPVYQALIQALDTEMGRLFRAMAEAGQLDNTVIFFMGDNGTPAPVKDSASRIRGSKWGVYEGGVRVPLVIAGPGVTRTGRDPHMISSPDIFATIAQLAGVPLTNNSINNSHSIVPLLSSSQATTGRKYSFTELCPNTGVGMKQFAIRDQRYKLLYSANTWQMFDLADDPWETTNLYDNPQHSGARSTLLGELRALRAKAATDGCFVDIPAP